MFTDLGKVLYWMATIVAGVVVVLALVSVFDSPDLGGPVIGFSPLLLALGIWLTGWFCRYVFSDR